MNLNSSAGKLADFFLKKKMKTFTKKKMKEFFLMNFYVNFAKYKDFAITLKTY